METIIHQIATKFIEKILKEVRETGLNLNEVTAHVLENCKEAAREMLQACAEEANQQMRKDKAWRKKQGLVMKEKDRPRKILTCLGELELWRDYYYDQENERYVTPLDEVMGIVAYERLLPTIGVELVTQATEHSYAKSAEIVTGGAVSRQTIRNQILKLQVPEKEAETPRKVVKELHLFADEDHVHMQKPKKEKGKKSQIVPLVTVTEGIGEEEGHRRTLKRISNLCAGKNVRKRIHGAIQKDDKKQADEIIQSLMDEEKDEKKIKRVKEPSGTYSGYAERMLSESLAGAENWSIFSQKEIVSFDQTSGTQQLLHRLGTPRSLLN